MVVNERSSARVDVVTTSHGEKSSSVMKCANVMWTDLATDCSLT